MSTEASAARSVVTTDRGLARDLRRWDLVALVVNSIIGAGIFGLPSRVYALAGTYSLLAYLISAVAIALVILCFAEVASRYRETGGPFLYARAAFGPFIGFQVGWLMWLARIAAFAALCNLAVGYLAYFLPAVEANPWRTLVIIVVVSALTFVNVIGVRATATVTNVFTLGKLIPLLLVAIAGLLFVDAERFSFAEPPSYGSFSQAALLLVFSYMGFEAAVIPAGETSDPTRHVPFALLTGIGFVAAIYALIQVVCIGTLPELANSARPLADAAASFLGAPGASLIAAGAVVSISGTMNALMFATPRLLFAMAEHGQLPRVLVKTHRGFQTPVVAILLTALVTLGLTLLTTFISALMIAAVTRLLAYITTCAALPILRRRPDAPPAMFVAPAGLLVSAGAVGLSVWLLSNSSWTEVRLVGVAFLVGLLLYLPSTLRRK